MKSEIREILLASVKKIIKKRVLILIYLEQKQNLMEIGVLTLL